MRIGVFPMMLGRDAAGPETYERELLRAMVAQDDGHEYRIWCLNQRAVDALDLHPSRATVEVLWPSARWVSMSTSLPMAIHRSGIDLLHATFTPPPLCPADYVLTMHGSVTFTHPHFYPPSVRARLNPLLRRGLNQARLILCVTEFVRQEMQALFGIAPERLVTVHHGVGSIFRPAAGDAMQQRLRHRHGLTRPYVIYVGKLHENKNIVRLLHAFHQATRGHDEVQLVLVGRRFFGSQDIEPTVQALGLQDRVVRLGHLPQNELPELYSGALCSVFPTLWEGFGLPVIEAMACGTPVLASAVACLPEVTDGAAMLVDPLSVDAMADSLRTLLEDADLRAMYTQRGLERAAQFSWERTARETLAAYQQAKDMA